MLCGHPHIHVTAAQAAHERFERRFFGSRRSSIILQTRYNCVEHSRDSRGPAAKFVWRQHKWILYFRVHQGQKSLPLPGRLKFRSPGFFASGSFTYC
jgi:hypothetical protein